MARGSRRRARPSRVTGWTSMRGEPPGVVYWILYSARGEGASPLGRSALTPGLGPLVGAFQGWVFRSGPSFDVGHPFPSPSPLGRGFIVFGCEIWRLSRHISHG